ncbi:MarR family winged helix-turn-helix transcriptional regulator [Actinospica sp.]|jgi:DNA-binding MarR family transcriptional regulator|uniref:MarR family winged helix-turn-helix transcriptional regulator n=1 Tax=Actinospica sp. TaxID=1872142 RepID=UPI002CF3D70C|nr:MarR family transcriptional regulator [Actinospica sp.]HWG24377.1 MarR family transcriptional regulator [Actinospica sp.]
MTPPAPRPPVVAVGELPPSVAFLLSRLGYEVSRELGEALAELDLEHREFGLLRLLADKEGHSQRALGAMLQIPPNRMVTLVDGLEKKGFVERRTHPDDRRAYALALTEDGNAALGRAFQAAFGVEARTCEPLDAAEREQLLTLLRKIAEAGIERGGTPPGMHPGMVER